MRVGTVQIGTAPFKVAVFHKKYYQLYRDFTIFGPTGASGLKFCANLIIGDDFNFSVLKNSDTGISCS